MILKIFKTIKEKIDELFFFIDCEKSCVKRIKQHKKDRNRMIRLNNEY